MPVMPVMAGETAIWTNNACSTVSSSSTVPFYWTNLTYWVDGGGVNLTEPPTNHTHDVVFGQLDGDGTQEIRWTGYANQVGNTYMPFGMLSITDTSMFSRRFINVYNDYASLKERGVTVTVDDPDGFAGFWQSRYGRVNFTLPATAERSPHLSNVSIAKRVAFDVPTAGTKAYLESTYERGTLEKRGAGELHVKATSGAATVAHVTQGTLTFEGRVTPDAGDDLPVPGAWLHLDASRTNTMALCAGDDGRTYVTNWADVRGNGNYAWFDQAWKRAADRTHLTDVSHPPFLNLALRPGMAMVDFGRANSSQDEAYGPVGCWMKLNVRKTGILEVFYAGQYLPASTQTTILGDSLDNSYPLHRVNDGLVASNYSPTHPIAYGDILFNGMPRGNSPTGPGSDFHVLCVGATNGVLIGSLGTDRCYASRTGGCRIGEVVLFTNRLTHAQRVQISNYLMRKWKDADAQPADVDAGVVTLAAADAALGVPEGRTARVNEVMAYGGTLVKEGAGTLAVGAVGSLGGEAPTVDVRGGKVAFEPLPPVPEDAPAADPFLWLDATAADSFSYTNRTGDTKQYVATWRDRRPEQTAVYASIPASTHRDYVYGAWPVRMEGVVGDKAVVDFGAFGVKTADAAFLCLNSAGAGDKAYEGFVVLKKSAKGGSIFGSNDILLYRANEMRLLNGDYGYYWTWAATWTVDGVPVDPIRNGQGALSTTEFHVVSVSAAKKLNFNFVGGKDREGQGTAYGGQQVAEQLLYDRVLTQAVRRQTIAYLLKRWRGESLPGIGPTRLAAMKFQANAPAVVDAVDVVEVEGVSGGDGTFVKQGAGTVSLGSLEMDGISSVKVEEGSMEMALVPADGSVFHFDASDLDALSYFVTGDGATTNVVSVADVRRNGMTANAWINFPLPDENGIDRAIVYTNPVWRAIAMPDGTARPAFDFGRKSNYYSAKFQSSAGLKLSRRFTNIREMHVVFSDNEAGDHENIVCDSNGSYDYLRDGASILTSSQYAKWYVTNGYVAVNGTVVPSSTALPAGFSLVSFATLSNTTVGAIGYDRNISAGGCYVSEYIGFTNQLTVVQRKFLQDSLMHKWFGAARAIWPTPFASIDVAAGATLALKGDVALSVAKISGGGTVTGGVFRDVAELEVACVGGTTVPATLTGDLTFAGAVTVTLTGDVGSLAVGGTYPLVNAGSFGEGLSGVRWTVTGLPERQRRRVTVSGGVLSLTLPPAGTTIFMR